MAASSTAADEGPLQQQDKWGPSDDQGLDSMGPAGDADRNRAPLPADEHRPGQDPQNPPFRRDSSVGDISLSGSKPDTVYREKQVKPNKVYVGGLPEHTRQEDLQSCFGKIGNIVNIELKVGYGFVEFDSREAAEESVAKYHEGYFMGNKIRVELSRGGGRTSKIHGDPGACFKCGQLGHWARECPNHSVQIGSGARHPHPTDPPLIERIQPSRDYPPPPRDYPPYRDEFAPPGRFPPPRDPRYGYDYPPLPPPGRELRRPSSPPRDYRDYTAVSAPVRSVREHDDYRMRGPPPLPRYERPGHYPPETDGAPGFPPRGYPPRDPYDRFERRLPPSDRYPSYPPPPSVRPTPPNSAVSRSRDDFDRSRDYPSPAEFRGRPPTSPSRYDYPPRSGSAPGTPPRYRRRSQSPPPRSSVGAPYDSASYSGASREGFPLNVYSGNVSAGPSSGPPPRTGGSSRDYPPRNGRDSRDAGDSSSGFRRT